MLSKSAQAIVQRFGELVAARSSIEVVMRDVAAYIRPLRREWRALYFTGEIPADAEPWVTDSTAMVALDNFTGGIFGALSNEANDWVGIKSFDDDLNQFSPVKKWLQIVGRRILNSYGPAFSPFYSQVPELYGDVAGLGTGCFFSEWQMGNQQIYDQCYSPFEVYFDVNNYRVVDTVYRPFTWTYRQAAQQWGEEKLSASLKAKSGKTGNDRCNFLHVVGPNDEYTPGMYSVEGFPWTDIYLELDHSHLIQRGGRHEFSYQCPRWSGTQTYGYGLGQRNLPDVKTVNAMDRGLLEATEWQNAPAILMQNRDDLNLVRPVPHKPIYGGMTNTGKRAVEFLQPTGNIPISFEITRDRREMIRDGFYYSLMQLAGRTGMDAVEIMQRNEEKMRINGPNMSRVQREFLSPSVIQRFNMLWRAGQIPPPPKEIQGQKLKIEYVSPMAKAQQSQKAIGTMRLIAGVTQLQALDPAAGDILDTDDCARTLQDAYGAPSSNLKSPEVLQQIRDARHQQQQGQTALGMGEQGAKIVKDLGGPEKIPGLAQLVPPQKKAA